MNRIDRLTAILIQLQSKKIVKAREIADRYRISLRTVYRDIRALEDAGVPLGSEPGKGYFLSEGYHLPPVMFTTQEAAALLFGGKLIEKYGDVSVDRCFAGAMDKVKAVLKGAGRDYLNRLDALVTVLKTASDSISVAEKETGSMLIDIQAFLARSEEMAVLYHSGYKDEVTSRNVEPLGLCFYAGRWHLLGYCHLRRAYRDFRVDRIKALETTGVLFDRDRHGSLDALVEKIVLSAELRPVKVVFAPEAARLIRDQKYYFGFVGQCETKDGIEIDFLVQEYDHLAHWLLSFADLARVERPSELRQIMVEHVRRLKKHYL